MNFGTTLLFILPLTATSFLSPLSTPNKVAPFSQRARITTPIKTTTTIPLPTSSSNTQFLLKSSRKDNIITEAASVEATKKSSKRGRLDENTRKKLVAESIAPWRTLRLFLYGSLGSGALLGGFITLSGVAAALSGVRDDVDLNTEYLNLAIDFGAAIVFAALAKFDFDKGNELSADVDVKIEKKKEQAQIAAGMRQREKQLSNLSLDIQVSPDGRRTEATIAAIQNGAKQNIILIVGGSKACKDALLGANLLKLDFSMSNVLVVPYELSTGETEAVKPRGGFGERPIYETQPYVARVTGEGWEEYVAAEVKDAVAQGGAKVKEEGIVIVLASTGRVIRRGVGKVPWRQMIEDLADEVAPGREKDN